MCVPGQNESIIRPRLSLGRCSILPVEHRASSSVAPQRSTRAEQQHIEATRSPSEHTFPERTRHEGLKYQIVAFSTAGFPCNQAWLVCRFFRNAGSACMQALVACRLCTYCNHALHINSQTSHVNRASMCPSFLTCNHTIVCIQPILARKQGLAHVVMACI